MKNILIIILTLLLLSGCDTWIDNNKTWKGDDKMCWLASTSNLIECKTGEKNVFQSLKEDFENVDWHPAKALRFLGYDPLSKRFEIESFKTDLESYGALIITYGSDIKVYHAITVWYIIGDTFLTTNSDDNYTGLVVREIIDGKLDGYLKIYGYYGI